MCRRGRWDGGDEQDGSPRCGKTGLEAGGRAGAEPPGEPLRAGGPEGGFYVRSYGLTERLPQRHLGNLSSRSPHAGHRPGAKEASKWALVRLTLRYQGHRGLVTAYADVTDTPRRGLGTVMSRALRDLPVSRGRPGKL